jgi:hypothetical protein
MIFALLAVPETTQVSIGREPTSKMGSSGVGGGSKGHDKIKQSFKCPRFSGNAKDWKLWHKGFLRFLSIWDLDYVVDPSFFDELPLSVQKMALKPITHCMTALCLQGLRLQRFC